MKIKRPLGRKDCDDDGSLTWVVVAVKRGRGQDHDAGQFQVLAEGWINGSYRGCLLCLEPEHLSDWYFRFLTCRKLREEKLWSGRED